MRKKLNPYKALHEEARRRFGLDPSKAYQRYIREVHSELHSDLAETPGEGFSLSDSYVEEVSRDEAASIILKYEWLQTLPMGLICSYGLKSSSGHLLGVVCFSKIGGKPGSLCTSPLASSVCLARGACIHSAPKNSASYLIRKACKMASKDYGWNVFFAYSDSDAGEIGTVYQASNWLYLGFSLGRGARGYHSDYRSPDGLCIITSYAINHDKKRILASSLGCPEGTPLRRHLVQNGWKKIKRYGKSKWVWFEGGRKVCKELKSTLRFPILGDGSINKPYPKRGVLSVGE